MFTVPILPKRFSRPDVPQRCSLIPMLPILKFHSHDSPIPQKCLPFPIIPQTCFPVPMFPKDVPLFLCSQVPFRVFPKRTQQCCRKTVARSPNATHKWNGQPILHLEWSVLRLINFRLIFRSLTTVCSLEKYSNRFEIWQAARHHW